MPVPEDATPRPSERLFGAQAQRACENFPPLGRALRDVPELVCAYAQVKSAAASVNVGLGVVPPAIGRAIVLACNEIVDGRHLDQFPTALLLGGGGTSTNMNVNEVVATLAGRAAGLPVHPLDHVNAGQSTNDTYPTAMALAVTALAGPPLAALDRLAAELERVGRDHDDVRHLGRTCLQDAVVTTAGSTHRAQATAVRRGVSHLRDAVDELATVPLGATVIGTGVGRPGDGYQQAVVEELARVTGRALRPAPDLHDALANPDAYLGVSAAAVRIAVTLGRIASDLRLRASGPNGGLAEITLPSVQAGSSIMPRKTNPVIPEFVMQLGYRIRGAAQTAELAVAAGELELNVMEPVLLDALVTILRDITAAADALAQRCVAGLRWDGPRLHTNAAAALDDRVIAAHVDGYDAVSEDRT